MILQTTGLNKRFGGVHVARSVDLGIAAGEIHCLIGPNGAGKSSLFRLILGAHRPDSGSIFFKDEDVTTLPSFARIRKGMSVKFQVPGIFKDLSVRQNLVISFQHHLHGHDLEATIQRVLAFAKLEGLEEQAAGTLSHGRQQWLEIGMAVGVEPSLLLLDPPDWREAARSEQSGRDHSGGGTRPVLRPADRRPGDGPAFRRNLRPGLGHRDHLAPRRGRHLSWGLG